MVIHRAPESVKLAIIGGVITVLTAGFGTVQAVLLARIQRQGIEAANKVEQVARATAQTNEEVRNSTEAASQQLTSIHTLVNANMGAQLKISAIALRRLAMLTHNEQDIQAAVVAEKLLYEHEKKQAIVDKESRAKGSK
jgi:hypothetical protein